MRTTLLVAAAATLVLGGCRSAPPTDLLDAKAALVEARAASLERDAVLERGASGLRLNDVLVRGFPAGPPGRLRFAVDVPKGARFQALVAIDPRYHQRPGGPAGKPRTRTSLRRMPTAPLSSTAWRSREAARASTRAALASSRSVGGAVPQPPSTSVAAAASRSVLRITMKRAR